MKRRQIPYWLFALVGIIAYVPIVIFGPRLVHLVMGNALSRYHPVFDDLIVQVVGVTILIGFLTYAFVVAMNRRKRKSLVEEASSLERVRAFTSEQFVYLTSEVFRRRGYRVYENSTRSRDGDIDLIVRKNGYKYLVQCKISKTQELGLEAARKMLDRLSIRDADGGYIVSSGQFSQAARKLSEKTPVFLIDGLELLSTIDDIQVDGERSLLDLKRLQHQQAQQTERTPFRP